MIDLGDKFARLTIIQHFTKDYLYKGHIYKTHFYVCECECGDRSEYKRYDLVKGLRKECTACKRRRRQEGQLRKVRLSPAEIRARAREYYRRQCGGSKLKKEKRELYQKVETTTRVAYVSGKDDSFQFTLLDTELEKIIDPTSFDQLSKVI